MRTALAAVAQRAVLVVLAVVALVVACQRADERAARVQARETADERAALEAGDRVRQGHAAPGGPAAPQAPGDARPSGWPGAIDDVLQQFRRLDRHADDGTGSR